MVRFLPLIRIGSVMILLWACNALADGKGPLPARQPPEEDGFLRISADDRCPVCGMYPSKRPKGAAGMVLRNGKGYYFCSNGCLLRTYRSPRSYLGVESDQIRKMVVQDYFTGTLLDAHESWWVAGSDVVGAMGPAIVALSDEAAVAAFRRRHGGEVVFRMDPVNGLDEELWTRILPKH